MAKTLAPRTLGLEDLAAIDRLHARCAEFWLLVEDAIPSADELMHELPPGVAAHDKHVLGVDADGELVALIDFVRGFPEPDAWYVGLLVVAPEARSSGLGAALFAHAEQVARAHGGTVIRLIVQEQNPRALAFWTRQGFVYEATTRQQVGRPNVVLLLCKPL
jgi:ribosomal protein S18 acetylase RimI-like enzyme